MGRCMDGEGGGAGGGREGVGVLWVYIVLGFHICVLIAGLEYCLACVLVLAHVMLYL